MPSLDPLTTALILIDLQSGVLGRPLAPRSGEEAFAAGKKLAERFRTARAKVVLVRTAFAKDFADAPSQAVDQPMQRPPGGLPPEWTELAAGLARPDDIIITKRQWGAFYGTELDLQLRRRGVSTIVLGGIATNFGVESTAREAWEHGYDVVLAEDACASVSVELHASAIQHIFPRIARVVQSADIVLEAMT
jgi:nicotinamidase-related amidase